MDKRVRDIVSRFVPERPFVWQMRLTEDDFMALESAVNGLEVNDQFTARCALIYVAEWYKRRYNGNNDCLLDSTQYQKACELSGIDCDKYIYRAADGKTRLWFLSMRLLGGLAALKECRNTRLLKKLFLLFRNELDDFSMSIVESESDAAVFKESILRFGSLYYFFDAVSRHEEIYAKDDLQNPDSAPARLYKSIEQVYDEVLRDKFEVEWIVDYFPCSDRLRRSLRLWLKPEEKGGLNEYLRLDRTNHWKGIGELRKVRRLGVSLRFINAEGNDVGIAQNVVNFENTGQESTGFIATGMHPYGMVKELPSAPYSTIEVCVAADDADPIVVQRIDCVGYAQLWLSADCPSRWTSRQRPQAPTAVVYNDKWSLIGTAPDAMLPFANRKYGLSQPWSWKEITDSMTLTDGNQEVKLWNREGYLQVTTRLYTDVIAYENGKVRHFYAEYPEYADEADTSELLPCIFGKEDVMVRKFTTRDFELTDRFTEETPELIEARNSGTRLFEEWLDKAPVEYGKIDLRLTIKGRQHLMTVAYLPRLNAETPIKRDFEAERILYRNLDDNEIAIKVEGGQIPVENPYVAISFGSISDYMELPIIKPFLFKEMFVDGVYVKRVYAEEYDLPYILKDRTRIHDFSKTGFQNYDTSALHGFYAESKGSPNLWEQGYGKAAVLLDPNAPTGMRVTFGLNSKEHPSDGAQLMYWDYDANTEPKAVPCDFDDMADYSILFQSPERPTADVYFPRMESDDWEAPDDISLFKCFETAIRYKTYFFIFHPLFEMSEQEFKSEILPRCAGNPSYIPFIRRLSEELGYDFANFASDLQK